MRYIHGGTGSRLYSIWLSMKGRCYCENWKPYVNYGGRGITVCDEWRDDYETFKEWAMSNGYSPELELDRINVNGNYTPENCQWITHHQQTLNRRDTLYLLHADGRIEKLYDFCINNHISRNTVNAWRYDHRANEKLSNLLHEEVKIIGGKKANTEL